MLVFKKNSLLIVKSYLILSCLYLFVGNIIPIHSHGITIFFLVLIPGFFNTFSILFTVEYLPYTVCFWRNLASFFVFLTSSLLWLCNSLPTLYFFIGTLLSIWILSWQIVVFFYKKKIKPIRSLTTSFALYSFMVAHFFFLIMLPLLFYIIYISRTESIIPIFWLILHPISQGFMIIVMGIIADKIYSNKTYFCQYLHISIIAFLAVLPMILSVYDIVHSKNPFSNSSYLELTIISIIPVCLILIYWLIGIWSQVIYLNVSTLFALTCMSLLVMSGIMDIFFVKYSLPIRLEDTYFTVAHFHLVTGICIVMAWLSYLYTYWHHMFQKTKKNMFQKRFYFIHFLITFIGVYIIFVIMQYAGLMAIPKKYFILNNPMYLTYEFLVYQWIIPVTSSIVIGMQVLFIIKVFWETWKLYTEKNTPIKTK